MCQDIIIMYITYNISVHLSTLEHLSVSSGPVVTCTFVRDWFLHLFGTTCYVCSGRVLTFVRDGFLHLFGTGSYICSGRVLVAGRSRSSRFCVRRDLHSPLQVGVVQKLIAVESFARIHFEAALRKTLETNMTLYRI